MLASWRAAAMLLWKLGRNREANAIELQCREVERDGSLQTRRRTATRPPSSIDEGRRGRSTSRHDMID
jgi:hypothetical protein